MPGSLLNSPIYTLADAFAYCDHLALRHYENFPVGSWMIPKAMRPYVHSIYAFARTADDYADEACYEGKGICSPEERIRLLDDWERQLEACYMGEASHPIFIALRETVRRFDMPIEPFKALLHAFRLDITVKRYPKFTDVLYYCKHSANPVGQVVLYLFGYRSPALHRLSDCICTALQLTNFWQDIATDLEKDRVYIPQADLTAFGYSEEDLLACRFNRAFRQLLCYQIKRTYQLFAAGWPLCQQVGRMLGLELRMIWFGGVRILERIEQANYDVFSRRPTLSWFDRGLFLLRALTRWGNEPP
jgi:squalene synthase HpnC